MRHSVVLALLLGAVLAFGQDTGTRETTHTVRMDGRDVTYKARAGRWPLRNAEGEKTADVFYIAYTVDEPGKNRPVMFSFNGGPGSSSVWLHMGILGPKRTVMNPDGTMPPPPFRYVDNEWSILSDCDLVFIDPVGTGYSRPAKPDQGSGFWGVQGDIRSVGDFIRQWMKANDRLLSPSFLIGESYGTFRAAGVAAYLVDQGVALNGVVMVSAIFNYLTTRPGGDNDLPFALYLPTFTATAHYHKKLPADLQGRPLRDVLNEVESWALDGYLTALAQGDRLAPERRREVVRKLARYTGLTEEFVESANLRVSDGLFYKELLRRERLIVGRLDSRVTGFDRNWATSSAEFDPSMNAIDAPYTATLLHYLRNDLKVASELEYHILGGGIGSWDYGTQGQGFAETAEALRRALARNPYMKVHVMSGYYDVATPYFAAEYTLAHAGIDPRVRQNVTFSYYEAGHMMYIVDTELRRSAERLRIWVRQTIGPQ